MAAPKPDRRRAHDPHRLEMIRLMEEIDAKAGVPKEPSMTIEELHAMQIAHGVRPEDNIGSRELMRMRYGDDWEHQE
jgi:hypothetical protein